MEFKIGQRVQISPGYDAWMRGDRYGEIERITTKSIHIRLDKSKRILKVPVSRPTGIYEIVSQPKSLPAILPGLEDFLKNPSKGFAVITQQMDLYGSEHGNEHSDVRKNPSTLLPFRIGAKHDAMFVTVSKKNQFGEYVVRLHENGKHYKPADYFTDDKEDAIATAQDVYRRASARLGIAAHRINPSGKRPEIHIDIDSHNVRSQEEMMRANPGDRYFVESHELANYAISNAQLYRSRIAPIILNLQRKKKRGMYDHALALKLWKYAADDAAQRYTQEYGSVGTNRSYGIFDVKKRMETAEILRDYYNEQVNKPFKRNPTLRATRPAKRKLHSRTHYDAGTRNLPGMGKIYVQKKHGTDWMSIAVAPHTNAGRKAAEFWAQRYHRKHPGSTLRLFV